MCRTIACVKNSFRASSLGRSSAVMVAFVHMPSRSGWPSGVRGVVHFFAAIGDWPVAMAMVASIDTMPLRARRSLLEFLIGFT